LPEASNNVDYEAELAVVIGTPARNVNAADAPAYIAGAMAFNDVSARDLQMSSSQWTLGKAIDTFGPCGPALVTMDEIADIGDLEVSARLNGQQVQCGRTSDMIFGIPEVIAVLSSVMTLAPGDLIITGTPAGVGMGRVPLLSLAAGDTIEVDIPSIGQLRNRVVLPSAEPRAEIAAGEKAA
jgi:2-keto-4-pentenoate hydratase/2-oxohepta-3-ene-1,7-dioic acid hydratase in catechol pathway